MSGSCLYTVGAFGSAIVTLGHTLLASGALGANFVNDSSTVINRGFNLADDNSCSSFFGPTDVTTSDAKLGPLSDNGGRTRTHAPLPGSPAIDAGSTNTAVAGLHYDQRGLGFDRLVNGRVDIGAYAVQQPEVSQVQVEGGVVSMVLQREPNETLTVEWNSEPTSTGWKTLITRTTEPAGNLQVTDSKTDAPRRFYRTVRK